MSNDNSNCLLSTLCDNLDELVTIFTEGGGRCSNGITGILVSVSCDACKLVTPSCGIRAGTVTVIPIDQITAVTICNTSF